MRGRVGGPDRGWKNITLVAMSGGGPQMTFVVAVFSRVDDDDDNNEFGTCGLSLVRM